MAQKKITLPIAQPGYLRGSGAGVPLTGTLAAWDMRDDFLRWDPEHYRVFFELAAAFGPSHLTRNDFEEWQRLILKAVVTRPKEWKTFRGEFDDRKVTQLYDPLQIRLEWDGETPIAKLGANTALGAIIATVQMDALRGERFAMCALEECNRAFRLGPNKKAYCTQAHAHLASVRRSRAKSKAKKAKKKGGM